MCWQAPSIQTRFPYNVLATDPTYDGTGTNRSVHQQFQSALHTDPATPDHEGRGWFGQALPHLDPSLDQYHIEGRLSSVTPERKDDSYEKKARIFSDSDGALRPHAVAMESPPLPFTSQPTPIVAYKRGVWGHADTSVSRPTGRIESEETTELSVRPPPVNDVGSKTLKKRKRATTSDETREEKRIHRERTRLLHPWGLTQVGIAQFRPTQECLVTTFV